MNTITLVIPAAVNGIPGIMNFAANYKIFSCISTTGTYLAQSSLRDVPFVIDSPGRGFGTKTGKSYGSVLLSNATAAIITTTIYVGDDPLPQNFIANAIAVTATIGAAAIATAQKLVTVAAANTAVAFGAAGLTFVNAKVIALKTAARAGNTGHVYIGASGAGTNQPYDLAPGDEITITAPAGYSFRFQDWFVNADNNGDGIVIIYS